MKLEIYGENCDIVTFDGVYNYWQPTYIRLDGSDFLVGWKDMWNANDETATREYPHRKAIASRPWPKPAGDDRPAHYALLVGPDRSISLRIPHVCDEVPTKTNTKRASPPLPFLVLLPEEIETGKSQKDGVSACEVITNGRKLAAHIRIDNQPADFLGDDEVNEWKAIQQARRAYGPHNIILRQVDCDNAVSVKSVARAASGDIILTCAGRSIAFKPLDPDAPTPSRFEIYGIIPAIVETSLGLASHALILYPVSAPVEPQYESIILGINVGVTLADATAGVPSDSVGSRPYGQFKVEGDFTTVWFRGTGYNLSDHPRERALIRHLAVDCKAFCADSAVHKGDLFEYLKSSGYTHAAKSSWKPVDAFGSACKDLFKGLQQRKNGRKPTGLYFIG